MSNNAFTTYFSYGLDGFVFTLRCKEEIFQWSVIEVKVHRTQTDESSPKLYRVYLISINKPWGLCVNTDNQSIVTL